MKIEYADGHMIFKGANFSITLLRYSDTRRESLAYNAARSISSEDIDNTKRPLSFIQQNENTHIFKAEYAEFEFANISEEAYSELLPYAFTCTSEQYSPAFIAQFDFLTLGEQLFPEKIWSSRSDNSVSDIAKGMFELVYNKDPILWDAFQNQYGAPNAKWLDIKRSIENQGLKAKDLARLFESRCLDISSRPLNEVLEELFLEGKTQEGDTI